MRWNALKKLNKFYFSDPRLPRSSIDDGDQSSPLRIRAYVYDGHHGYIQQISINPGTPERLNNNEIDFEEDSLSNRSTNTETVLKTSEPKSCCDNSQPNNSDILYAIDYKESDASYRTTSSETYTLEVEYMITAFQPMLVDTIRVSDVLPYIDFLDSFTDVKRPVRNRRSNKQYTTPAYGQWRPLPEVPRNRSWHNRRQLQSDGSAPLHLTNNHERYHIERNNGAHLLNNGGYEFHENIENGKAQTDASKEIATLYQRLMEDIKEEISKQIENVKDHVTNTVTNALLYSGSIRTFASEPHYATVDSLPTDSNYRPIPIYTTGRRSHFLQRPTFYTDPVFDTSVDSGTSNIQSYTV